MQPPPPTLNVRALTGADIRERVIVRSGRAGTWADGTPEGRVLAWYRRQGANVLSVTVPGRGDGTVWLRDQHGRLVHVTVRVAPLRVRHPGEPGEPTPRPDAETVRAWLAEHAPGEQPRFDYVHVHTDRIGRGGWMTCTAGAFTGPA